MTSKPTICVECEHIRDSIPESECAAGAREKMNYVSGIPYLIDAEICARKNHEGKCPDFEAKEERPEKPEFPEGRMISEGEIRRSKIGENAPPPIHERPPPPPAPPGPEPLSIREGGLPPTCVPETPSPMSEGPSASFHADGYLGPECPLCRSDMKRKWWIVGPLLGCINEDCRNYWRRNVTGPKSSRLTEGRVRKGGLGIKPLHPPSSPPKGQRPVPKE